MKIWNYDQVLTGVYSEAESFYPEVLKLFWMPITGPTSPCSMRYISNVLAVESYHKNVGSNQLPW